MAPDGPYTTATRKDVQANPVLLVIVFVTVYSVRAFMLERRPKLKRNPLEGSNVRMDSVRFTVLGLSPGTLSLPGDGVLIAPDSVPVPPPDTGPVTVVKFAIDEL